MNNAKFYNIPESAGAAMAADMDAACAGLWAYPDAEWQAAFEAEWLARNGYSVEAE